MNKYIKYLILPVLIFVITLGLSLTIYANKILPSAP